jgi:hypothetical protein
LDDLVTGLQAVRAKAAPEATEALGINWSFFIDSTVKMHDLLQGKEPPDSQPGDYEFGPVLPVIYYELPDSEAAKKLVELLQFFGLPDPPIAKGEWDDDLKVLDGTGRVASDGSLVAHSDLAVADYCWVIAVLKYVLLEVKLDTPHPFIKASGPIQIPASQSSLTLALAGDWGSGEWVDPGKVYPAKAVLAQMQALAPDYMVHLGDVYYAGTPSSTLIDPDEERRYFTTLWKGGSRGALALNSNHEMYSGANGLFEALGDPLFADQGGATYFAIEFQDWLVLGLDTAYHDPSFLFMDGALNDPDQVTFIKSLSPQNKRVLVLTHHNGLVYAGEKRQPLWDQVCGALGKQPEVWYWGHIHNGIVYSSSSQAGTTLARCCGHGSLPFGDAYGLRDSLGKPIPTVSYYAHTPLLDPEVPPQRYRVLNGFATLCLEEGKIYERFYEQGNPDPVWEKPTAF